ncbi:hypothetical protein BC739_007797 [Kutzneria viridogrisea]|uniref:Uncharacterized protein n=1 Tax=Kutzneria viridogrisea TaxID=47990 RepID=A0ABR6BUF2_9PSEU|nr:hypothetical protein [Kutzneria viridogrisea]
MTAALGMLLFWAGSLAVAVYIGQRDLLRS